MEIAYEEWNKDVDADEELELKLASCIFSIDRFSHVYGPNSQKTKGQLKMIF